MNLTKEEIRDMALRLHALYMKSPEDFAYVKGWVHCLLYNENEVQDIRAVAYKGLEDFFDGI